MIDSMPDRVVRIRRRDGRIEYCNLHYTNEYRVRPKDLIGQTIAEHLGEQTWSVISKRLLPLTSREPRSSAETRWVRPDGSILVESWTHCLVDGADGTDDVFAVGHDISVRAEAQKALAESEVRNRAILSNLPVAAVVTGATGVLFANDAAAELIGVTSPNELLGEYPSRRWGVNPGFAIAAQRDVADGTFHPHKRTETFDFPSGARTVELHLSSFAFDGQPALLAVGVDVTEQRATAAALATAAELQHFLAENSTDGLVRADEHLRVLYSTDATQQLFGLNPNDLVGVPLFHLVAPPDRATLEKMRVDAIGTGHTQRGELRAQHTDPNKDLWVDITLQTIAHDGSIEHHIAVADSTDRHRVQQQLNENEEFVRSIISALTEGVMLSNAEGAVVLGNDAARRLLHLRPDSARLSDVASEHTIVDALGTPIDARNYPSTLVHATNRAIDEMVIGMQHNVSGKTSWFLTNSRPLFREGTQLALSTFVDITDHKEMELRLAADQRLLDATLQHLDASVVAVDIEGDVVFMNRSRDESPTFHDTGLAHHRTQRFATTATTGPMVRSSKSVMNPSTLRSKVASSSEKP